MTSTSPSHGVHMRQAPALCTLSEAAEAARTPLRTVRHWIACGRLPSKRPGRRVLIRRCDLAALMGVDERDLEIVVRSAP